MTRFGATALVASLVLVVAAMVKSDTPELRGALLLLAGVLIGALIAVEARHQSIVWRQRREHDDDHP